MFEEAMHGAPRHDSPRKRAQIKQCALLAGCIKGCPCAEEGDDHRPPRPVGMFCQIPEAIAIIRQRIKKRAGQ